MAQKTFLRELEVLGESIERALAADKKKGKSSKTSSYKSKRIQEATDLWDSYNKKLSELLKLVDENEPCVKEVTAKYSAVYKEYTDRLLAIPDDKVSEDDESSDDDNELLLKTQSKRFVTLRHIMQEILIKIDTNEKPSSSYSEVKKQKLLKLWDKIENDDELIGEETVGYKNYQTEFKLVETLVDKSLIFLQDNIASSSARNSSDGLRLNRVQIQKFGGDYFKWFTFKDLFTTMVIDNKKMGNAEKMQCLKTHLTPEIEDMISDLNISDANFESAWQRLMGRFNNERVIIYRMINKLLYQQNCKGDAKSIKKILDTTDQMMLALKNLKRPTEHWNDWVVVVIGQKLDTETQKDWEKKIGKATTVPTWEELKEFLEEQFRLMERLEHSNKRQGQQNTNSQSGQTNKNGNIKAFQATVEGNCIVCQETHTLYNCPQWKSMKPKERLVIVKRQKWCKRCLRLHNDKVSCDKICKKCNKGHSTWLHENRDENQLTAAHGTFTTIPYKVLLATALVKSHNMNGDPVFLRVLIDSGSEGSLITERAAAMLNVKSTKSDRWVQGLTGQTSEPLKKVHIKILPRFDSNFEIELDFYILKSLTKMLPGHDLNINSWKHIQKLVWADPKFYKRGPIDALLGMDAIVDLIRPGLVKGMLGQPMAQETHLGWIMSGRIDPTYPSDEMKCFVSTIAEINSDLSRFWELEELNPERNLTADEIECENMYDSSVRKHENGQFITRIPFKHEPEGPARLGDSRGQAIARFLQLERKLNQNKELGVEYRKVIQEYIDLGHMVDVTDSPKEEKLYYIPHHVVIKPDRLTTKYRVVFDASAKTTTGWSLNECMHVGGKQQRDLNEIIMSWRIPRIVYKADISKMYRMIQLDPEDQKYQIIVWRNSSKEPLKEYKLTTTTFGTAAAPFLATRTLVQISKEQQNNYPLAAEAIKNNFYVDDLIGGSNTIEEAIQCKNELLASLEYHKLHLRKWTSNSKEFLDSLPPEMTEKSLINLSESGFDNDISKALGLAWNPKNDQFLFKVNWLDSTKTEWTKRSFLAETSRLFDPLGWLAPITINAKLMMQEVYEAAINWDQPIPDSVAAKWSQFRQEFNELENIRIDRWMGLEQASEITLHGFSDASEKAYSATVYARVKTDNQIITRLVTSKTRVASIKTKISLPRLELCGAVLVSNLMVAVQKALKLTEVKTFMWTDSMITLGWVRKEPKNWKTFVANRVAEIQNNHNFKWDYVPSEENPADCASRGLMPLELVSHSLWWNGPAWLKEDLINWPTAEVLNHDLEQRNNLMINVTTLLSNDTITRISSWNKLGRIAAYCLRFKTKHNGNLTATELQYAKTALIRKCQEESFPQEITALQKEKTIDCKSKLKSLNIFLDVQGVLRVGGRLINSQLPYGTKHPMVLPAKHHITKIIIKQMHQDTLHGGPKLMKNLLMNKYWIIQGKRMIHNEVSQCITCRRFAGASYKQQMGDLPESRVTFDRPFSHTGIDYAGPIELKSSNLRAARIQKGYVALYICMSTKAVHLELVSDQTTEAFLASFNRFAARRSLPTVMYSDNGTTFEGADNQLQRMYLLQQNEEISKVIVNQNVEWQFIPPKAPNFGGLWERAIRSMKEHLKKTLKTARLTFEEYNTLLCQVEACLNSRPLCALSDDTDNFDVLTPGHFLVGQALMAPPQPNVGIKLINNRNRWIYVNNLHKQLWDRWNKEYLIELQQRHKWHEKSDNAKVGDLVAVKEDDIAPRNWLIGRIEEVHQGSDGMVRVATVRIPAKAKNQISNNTDNTDLFRPNTRNAASLKAVTKEAPKNSHIQSKLLQRPIRKLCPLITDNPHEELGNQLKQNLTKSLRPDVPTKKYNLRPRKVITMTMALIFLGFLFGIVSTRPTDCINTQLFEHNAGIYFEDVGRASMTKSDWKIQIYFDLDEFYKDLSMVNNTINKLEDLCGQAEQAISNSAGLQCSHTIHLLKNQLEDIIQMNSIIQQNKQISTNRTKRAAPFNFIGWIGNKLFGIMDATAAEKFEERIEKVKSGLEDLNKLISEQTSIIELTRNLIKESQEESRQKFEMLTTAIIKLSKETDLYRKRDQIIGWALYTSMVLNKLEKSQENMVNMLTDLQQGHISSYLFTPQQFKKELDKINDLIPNDQQLPINPQKDIKSFYELMRGQMRVTKNHILLEITIPLVSVEEFQIFNIIPVPVQYKHELVCIVPESQYLLINLKRNIFYQFTDNEINSCIKTQSTPFVCPAIHSTESVTSSKGKCERELLAGSKQIQHCQINVVPDTEVWIHLKPTNNWLFGLRNKTILNVVKGSNVDTVTLQGNGILSIQPGCEVSHHGSTIIGHSQITTTSVNNFRPVMNLSELIQGNLSNLNVLNFTMSNTEKFHEINQKVRTIHSTIEWHHTLYWASQITVVILVIIIGITIIVIHYKSRLHQWWLHQFQQAMSPISSQHDRQSSRTETSTSIIKQPTNSGDTIKIIPIKVEQPSNSDDSDTDMKTIHGPGGCPFKDMK